MSQELEPLLCRHVVGPCPTGHSRVHVVVELVRYLTVAAKERLPPGMVTRPVWQIESPGHTSPATVTGSSGSSGPPPRAQRRGIGKVACSRHSPHNDAPPSSHEVMPPGASNVTADDTMSDIEPSRREHPDAPLAADREWERLLGGWPDLSRELRPLLKAFYVARVTLPADLEALKEALVASSRFSHPHKSEAMPIVAPSISSSSEYELREETVTPGLVRAGFARPIRRRHRASGIGPSRHG